MTKAIYRPPLRISFAAILSACAFLLPGCSKALEPPCQKGDTEIRCDVSRINTRGWVDSPYVTPDGQRLYFLYNQWNFFEMFFGGQVRRIGPERPGYRGGPNAWGGSNTYVSTRRQDGGWSPPVSHPVNRYGSTCCLMESFDGSKLIYQIQVRAGKGLRDGDTDLCYSERGKDGAWSKPIVYSRRINTKHLESNPHLSRDGKILFWSSNRPDGHGKLDLWYSKRRRDGTWAEAHNMGPNINTEGDEDQVWADAHNTRIYFNRETKIFVSDFMDGRWAKAERVRFKGRAAGAEVSLTDDGKRMYFALVDRRLRALRIVYSERLPSGEWGRPLPVD